MRMFALLVAMAGTVAVGPRAARAEERKLHIEAEVLQPDGKPIGKLHVVVAARGEGTAKATFGSVKVVLDAEVGPTFKQDCNLATVKVRQEDGEATGADAKREMKANIQSCGPTTPPATLPGGGASKVVVTIRPSTS
jgi:hypothetical protein